MLQLQRKIRITYKKLYTHILSFNYAWWKQTALIPYVKVERKMCYCLKKKKHKKANENERIVPLIFISKIMYGTNE